MPAIDRADRPNPIDPTRSTQPDPIVKTFRRNVSTDRPRRPTLLITCHRSPMTDDILYRPIPIGSRVIGLTGGIAMGKTTLSDYLAQVHHLPVLDADRYARDAVVPGSRILQAIAEHFGVSVLQPDGSLDRKTLGHLIFSDPPARHWLEQQIHPFVRQQLLTDRDRALQTDPQRPVILVIPLLFEAEMTDLVNEIWVVYCPPDQQIQRLMQRESLARHPAEARIASQMDIQKKCDRAHLVLDNSLTIEFLLAQVDQALARDASYRSPLS